MPQFDHEIYSIFTHAGIPKVIVKVDKKVDLSKVKNWKLSESLSFWWLMLGIATIAVAIVSDMGEDSLYWQLAAPIIIFGGIYLQERIRYVRGLEDIIRYLNAKYKLYHKPETYNLFGHKDETLKPEDESENEFMNVGKNFQSDYQKAVWNSRNRLKNHDG